ncbi:MAG: hypothetical protein KJO18_05855 [Acidimicrobiia bacterium]|nr:hypothetical protein [Acidimicrobiia bacterium]
MTEAVHLRGYIVVSDRRRTAGERLVWRGALAITAFALVATACGGGTDDDGNVQAGGTTVATVSSQRDVTNPPTGTLPDQTFVVGQEFWHSGFHAEVSNGEIVSTTDQLSDQTTTVLTLAVTLENLGTDSGFFGPDIAVVTANNSYPASFTSELNEVPGGLKGQASLVFNIDPAFDLDTAELLIGDPSLSQARIPLNPSGAATRLAPTTVPMSGVLSMQLIDLTFTGAELRYDKPDLHRNAPAGKQVLTLNFDILSRKGGNWNIFADNLALILPSGIAISAEGGVNAIAGSDQGITTADQSMSFLVDDMPAGDYVLRFSPGSWFVGDDDVTDATFEFSIG